MGTEVSMAVASWSMLTSRLMDWEAPGMSPPYPACAPPPGASSRPSGFNENNIIGKTCTEFQTAFLLIRKVTTSVDFSLHF